MALLLISASVVTSGAMASDFGAMTHFGHWSEGDTATHLSALDLAKMGKFSHFEKF